MIIVKDYFRQVALYDLGFEVDDYIIRIHNYLTDFLDKLSYIKVNDDDYHSISLISHKTLFVFNKDKNNFIYFSNFDNRQFEKWISWNNFNAIVTQYVKIEIEKGLVL